MGAIELLNDRQYAYNYAGGYCGQAHVDSNGLTLIVNSSLGVPLLSQDYHGHIDIYCVIQIFHQKQIFTN